VTSGMALPVTGEVLSTDFEESRAALLNCDLSRAFDTRPYEEGTGMRQSSAGIQTHSIRGVTSPRVHIASAPLWWWIPPVSGSERCRWSSGA